MAIKIDYEGERWHYFASLAGKFNADLRDEYKAKSWTKRSHSWRALQAVMGQPFLDPIVQAISDMTAEPFSLVRREALTRIWDYENTIAARNVLLVRIDPFLSAWLYTRWYRLAMSKFLDRSYLRRLGSDSIAKSAEGMIEKILAYTDHMLRIYSMTPEAARAEFRVFEGDNIPRREVYNSTYEDILNSGARTLMAIPRNPNSYAVPAMSMAANMAISTYEIVRLLNRSVRENTPWNRLVEQRDAAASTASDPSPATRMTRIVNEEVSLLNWFRNFATMMNAQAAGVPSGGTIQDMMAEVTEENNAAITSYPPTPEIGSSGLVHSAAAPALIAGAAFGAIARYMAK